MYACGDNFYSMLNFDITGYRRNQKLDDCCNKQECQEPAGNTSLKAADVDLYSSFFNQTSITTTHMAWLHSTSLGITGVLSAVLPDRQAAQSRGFKIGAHGPGSRSSRPEYKAETSMIFSRRFVSTRFIQTGIPFPALNYCISIKSRSSAWHFMLSTVAHDQQFQDSVEFCQPLPNQTCPCTVPENNKCRKIPQDGCETGRHPPLPRFLGSWRAAVPFRLAALISQLINRPRVHQSMPPPQPGLGSYHAPRTTSKVTSLWGSTSRFVHGTPLRATEQAAASGTRTNRLEI
ncbi:hypothetical protein QBC35DRAFT_510616 [Podospora australis]|uniref:Uncharacterized protein n=1 Tax=Podospora australis TaxID=1536484 RepID=A0AAN6WIY0_9PEZI|nr:hypothetical protein QBC35DRAFT_510616 [Podospora australis]